MDDVTCGRDSGSVGADHPDRVSEISDGALAVCALVLRSASAADANDASGELQHF
jgi:hypothetical protein